MYWSNRVIELRRVYNNTCKYRKIRLIKVQTWNLFGYNLVRTSRPYYGGCTLKILIPRNSLTINVHTQKEGIKCTQRESLDFIKIAILKA